MTANYLQRSTGLLGLLICLALTTVGASGQNTSQDSCSKHPCNGTAASDQTSSDATLQAANQDPEAAQPASQQTGFLNTNYTVSLNGGPAIALQSPRHLVWLYALSTSQGYDSNIAGPFSNVGTYTSVYEGYLGALWRYTRGYFLVQQDSAYTHFGSSLLQGAGFYQTSILSSVDFAPSLNWTFSANSAVGNNTLTELIPPTQTIVNGVPVISPANATAGIDLGFVWGTDLVSILNWKPDSRDIFSFRAENANEQFYGLDSHDNLATFKLTYLRELSENLFVGGYGIERHETGELFCDSYGYGLSVAVKPAQRLFLQAEGGPDYDSAGCFVHQGFELHFSGTYQISRSSYIYAIGDRQLSSGFVPFSTWQNDAGIGLAKQLTRRLWWSVGGGYDEGYIVPSLQSYHGYFAQTEFRQRLSSSFDLEGLYRRMDENIPGLSAHRNIVLFTLRWSPRRHDPGRTAMYQTTTDYRSGRDE